VPETDGELLDLHSDPFSGQEMAQLVPEDHEAETEDEE
jgi:hypothetical protein